MEWQLPQNLRELEDRAGTLPALVQPEPTLVHGGKNG